MENIFIPAFFSQYPNNLNFDEQIKSLESTENFINWNINKIKKEENIIYESLLDKAIQFMKNIVNDGIKYISDLWKKFIDKLKIMIKKIDIFYKKYNNKNNIISSDKNLKALFAFSNRGRIQTISTIDKLFTFYQKSLSLICGEIDRQYRTNIDLLSRLKEHQTSYKEISDSFIIEKITYFNDNKNFIALNKFDKIFLENTLSNNNLEELIKLNADCLNLYNALSSYSSYIYDYLCKKFYIYNKKEIYNTSLMDLYDIAFKYNREYFSKNFSEHIYIQYYPKDNDGKNRLIEYITFIILRNESIIECLINLLRIDFNQFKINLLH